MTLEQHKEHYKTYLKGCEIERKLNLKLFKEFGVKTKTVKLQIITKQA